MRLFLQETSNTSISSPTMSSPHVQSLPQDTLQANLSEQDKQAVWQACEAPKARNAVDRETKEDATDEEKERYNF